MTLYSPMPLTHAERQAAYRERLGWAGRRKDRDRKRVARGTSRTELSVTIDHPVRDAKRPVREVPETHYETDDEAYEREHAPRMRPLPATPGQMEPNQRVVAPNAIYDGRREEAQGFGGARQAVDQDPGRVGGLGDGGGDEARAVTEQGSLSGGTEAERRIHFQELKADMGIPIDRLYNVMLTKPNMRDRAAPETSPQLLEIEDKIAGMVKRKVPPTAQEIEEQLLEIEMPEDFSGHLPDDDY